MTSTIDSASRPSAPRRRARRVVIDRAPAPSEVQERLENDRRRYGAGMVAPDLFASALAVEFSRREHGGRNCGVASLSVFEMPGIRHRHGDLYVFDRVTELTGVVAAHVGPGDVFHVAENGDVLVLGRDSPIGEFVQRIEQLTSEIAGRRFDVGGEDLLFTPSAGVATLDDATAAGGVVGRAIDAREVGESHLDLRVHRWEPAMSADTAPPAREPFRRFGWQTIKEKLRAPSQILATYVIGLVLPFCIYWFFDAGLGFDITWAVYVFCVATLVLTGVMILVEAHLAAKQKEPPEVDSYPDASAIICAYLPNEAATIRETLDAFLNQGYPANLQVILAYNTPNPMPVERELHALADEHPNLEVVKVEGSTSKAQNVNAVLHMATGEFTGMFDADHMPRPGSFERAWRWLANGYDVVQGHCLTRNGEETWLARMIAVEFESIYAVAHPGRARLHGFGVFGGSNGYWKTDLLHETRMRGSMLTEDIDSSMRTVERGLKIRSDRDIVSRELATTTMKQVWNQRLRWAQGWYQVTLRHAVRVWKSPGLTLRHKIGASYLLGYREIYPWLSLQVFPLVAYWFFVRGDALRSGWPLFFITTIFVLHVGPAQTAHTYRLADPEIKQHKSWFWGYLLFSTFFYTEFKNTIARVAHVKEWVGERAWKVTPRSDAPVEFDDDLDLGDDEEPVAASAAAPPVGDHARVERRPEPLTTAPPLDEWLPQRVPGSASPMIVAQPEHLATASARWASLADVHSPSLGRTEVAGEPLVPSRPGVNDATDAFGMRRPDSPDRDAAWWRQGAGDRRATPSGQGRARVPGEPLIARHPVDELGHPVPLPVRSPAEELASMVVELQDAAADDRAEFPGRLPRRVTGGRRDDTPTELVVRRRPNVLGHDAAASPPIGGPMIDAADQPLPVRRRPDRT